MQLCAFDVFMDGWLAGWLDGWMDAGMRVYVLWWHEPQQSRNGSECTKPEGQVENHEDLSFADVGTSSKVFLEPWEVVIRSPTLNPQPQAQALSPSPLRRGCPPLPAATALRKPPLD